MKLTSFFTLLLIASTNVLAANWVKVATSNNGDVFLVDSQSIQRKGNVVTLWLKTNNAVRSKHGDLSTKVQHSINCATRDHRVLYYFFYDDLDNMGKITDTFSTQDSTWKPIPPDSVIDLVLKYVCK